MPELMLDLQKLMDVANAAGAISGGPRVSRKEASLSISTLPSLTGTRGLFVPAGDTRLLTLVLQDEPFLTWLGWKPDNTYDQFVKILSYVGGSGTAAGSVSTPYVDACADGNGVEFGTAEVLLPDKGRMKRVSPSRDITENNRQPWTNYPIYTVDGQQITDQLTWSIMMAGIALSQDIKRSIFESNPASSNQYAGLQKLVNVGYQDIRSGRVISALDSILLNWGSQAMSATPVGTYNLYDYLADIIREIWVRCTWSNLGVPGANDMILVMPSPLKASLLDLFSVWSVMPGAQYQEINLQNYEVRQFRQSLNGGPFGDGFITVDNKVIPILCYDWMPFTVSGSTTTSDIYVLTRALGTIPTLWGQYIDMRDPAQAAAADLGLTTFKATDDGKFLVYPKTMNECVQYNVMWRGNLFLSAPWACARILNVQATRTRGPLSPDPASDYYPEKYLGVASYPNDYAIRSMSS